uniref:Exonuclease 1 n=1 Tax=Globisporangium ultimum (strain ATCC 200006 / CBS 805.95 / DAOM BR144) TaxID=431595 RepID=K3WAC9_GLOUD
MGIDGFLRQMKDALEERHVRSYSGQTVVVDAFSWLHKACYGCAFELGTGQRTDSYIQYMLRKVELLRSCGVKQTILVFDGQRLPLKALTHGKRQGSKEENRKVALQCLQNAKRLRGNARSEEMAKAYQHFARAVSITQEIVTNVMNALRASDIPFVVAPFEADAQMVWMCKTGAASAIVTEDSDVFLYCIATGIDTHVLFKLDDQGFVQTLSRPSLRKHSEASSNPFMKKLYHLTTGEQDATRMFVQFCALSGCDFLDSLPNMGIVTALKQVFNFRGAPGHLRVQRIVSKLSAAGAKIPPDFLERFAQAESIFFHHVIFNPGQQRCEFLITGNESACISDIFELVQASLGIKHSGGSDEPFNLHTAAMSKSSYLGIVLPADVVSGIYNGSVCPRTLRYLSATHEEPDTVRLRSGLPFGFTTQS